METVTAPGFSSSNTSYEFDLPLFRDVKSHVRYERFDELLKLIDIDGERHKPVNLMNDPVLNVVISANKTQLAVKLIEKVTSIRPLLDENIYGDTALHTAAVEGNNDVANALLKRESELVEVTAEVEGNNTVAEAPLQRESQLMKAVNKKGETAVHKAAMYGHQHMFLSLVEMGGTASARKKDGSNMLHCAIMGNAPELALNIARKFPDLILSRDDAGLTPLQLIVTNPSFLRNPLSCGTFNIFLYYLISLEGEERFRPNNAIADEEAGWSVDRDRDEESYEWTWKSVRSKFHSQYSTPVILVELIACWVLSGVLVILKQDSWLRYGVLKILKQFYPSMNVLEKEMERYMAAMKLIEYLAMEMKGYTQEPNPTVFDAMWSYSDLQYTRTDDGTKEGMLKYILNEADQLPNRWMEPPLIIAAELGLDNFVCKLLEVCPQSAIYLDSKGRNVMQVAIQSGHGKVVRVISEILQGSNPVLRSGLLSMLDSERNTIFHLAAERSPAMQSHYELALQLCHELEWFELVEKIVPRELVDSRNRKGKTAHELFTNRHEKTLEECRQQMVKIGGTCAGLVMTVVLTSSFSFPNVRDNASGSSEFTIVYHTYMFGLGCAATALLLFVSLVQRSYTMHDFRLAIPSLFSVAWMSFVLALITFYVTVVHNMILQIYGGKLNTKHWIRLILELVLYPVVCFYVLLRRGIKIIPSFRI